MDFERAAIGEATIYGEAGKSAAVEVPEAVKEDVLAGDRLPLGPPQCNEPCRLLAALDPADVEVRQIMQPTVQENSST